MSQIHCQITQVIYQNSEELFSILRVKNLADSTFTTIKGNIFNVRVGTELLANGNWESHSKFGDQLSVTSWEEILPTTIPRIESYLASGLIRGINKGLAKRITKVFGIKTLEIIDKEPENLSKIRGIGSKKIEQIKESWQKNQGVRNLVSFLQQYGVNTVIAIKIYKRYRENSIETLRENPWSLADDIYGIGFQTADTIAEKLGFPKNHPLRCASGLIYVMHVQSQDGHVCIPQERLLKKTSNLLSVEEDILSGIFYELVNKSELIMDDGDVYLPVLFQSEVRVAEKLAALISSADQTQPDNASSSMDFDLNRISDKFNITFNKLQEEAIRTALCSKVMILTGGPGTGKTTTIQGIIQVLENSGKEILLAAPTGRAAKRMTETTGREAKTIHRLLEYNPAMGYNKNSDTPLEGDALIVDETSMIDIRMMAYLLAAIPQNMKLVLVGDIDQLPSVGPGNVLRDLINSNCIPTVNLTEIFRQAQNSQIIMNAHRVNEGKLPKFDNKSSADHFFLKRGDTESSADLIVDLVARRLPSAYNINPNDIQVLSPTKKGALGVKELNKRLQKTINKSTIELVRGESLFRLGDKVMQIKNNYDKDIFNGDIGIISKINTEDRIISVSFDEHEVCYNEDDMDELTLSYATTIHKSQGSEYPIVVMPISESHFVMLQRNLLYTGMTRAKKTLIFVGTENALNIAVQRVVATKRNTKLCQRLTQLID